MNLIRLKTNELFDVFNLIAIGNWVTIAMMYVADAIIQRNLHTKYEYNTN